MRDIFTVIGIKNILILIVVTSFLVWISCYAQKKNHEIMEPDINKIYRAKVDSLDARLKIIEDGLNLDAFKEQ